MRGFWIGLFLSANWIVCARADLTIVQKVEGLGRQPSEITIKIKGDKVRMDASPKLTTIFNGKTGEMINLMSDQKTVVRISADKMKAAAEMIKEFGSENENVEKPKLVATGQKETINGFSTEQYVYDGPRFKAEYWIAQNYPNGAEILKQLRAVKSEVWNTTKTGLPDLHDFPGLPIRTHMTLKRGDADDPERHQHHGSEITTTITAVKEGPLDDSEFAVPKDFKELSMPDIFGGRRPHRSGSPSQ